MLLEVCIKALSLKQDTRFLKKSLFPLTIIEWNKGDHNTRNSNNFNFFRKSILKIIRPYANCIFNKHNPKVIKFITRLRLGLSQLWEHKFKQSFQDSVNLFCNCGIFFTDPRILLKNLLS